ncbi:MAG: transposase [Candidatus Methylomirabilales bacterium]
MARPLRIEFPDAYYHILNRGLAHQNIFSGRSDRAMFLRLLGECHEMWGIRVIAYCLLDNHYHLLVQTPEANLSRIMRHLNGLYTQRYNRRNNRDGPLFRGRYQAIIVDAEQYLLAVARYIHQNPVAAGLVRSPEGYAWSSCRLYVDEGRRPSWLDTAQLLSLFPQKNRRAAFVGFMKSAVDKPVRLFYESERRLPVLGSTQFRDRLRRRVRKRAPDLTEVSAAKAYVRPDAMTCLTVVGQVYGTGRGELLRSRRGQRNEARAVAIYVCRRLAGMKLEEIGKLFGMEGYSAVSSVIGRTEREVDKRGETARRFERIRKRLQR